MGLKQNSKKWEISQNISRIMYNKFKVQRSEAIRSENVWKSGKFWNSEKFWKSPNFSTSVSFWTSENFWSKSENFLKSENFWKSYISERVEVCHAEKY